MRYRPLSKDELSQLARFSCSRQKQKILQYRRKKHTAGQYKSTKNDRWDTARVVVACGSLTAPYKVEKRYNSSTLKNGHATLKLAYSLVGMTIGQKISRHIKARLCNPCWEPGHCAEPHAAHALLNTMEKKGVILQIHDIRFGIAFDIINCKPKLYCNTCKAIFPQLI